jgi:hypothetical protein
MSGAMKGGYVEVRRGEGRLVEERRDVGRRLKGGGVKAGYLEGRLP